MLWRCYACLDGKTGMPGHDFESEAAMPTCPKCLTDSSNPRHVKFFTRRETVHFDAPSGLPDTGVGHLACDPSERIPQGERYRFTSEPRSVTCPKCRETAAWIHANKHGAGSVAGKVDPDKLEIKSIVKK